MGGLALVFTLLGHNDIQNKAHRAYCESVKGEVARDGCVVGDKFIKLPQWMIDAGLVE